MLDPGVTTAVQPWTMCREIRFAPPLARTDSPSPLQSVIYPTDTAGEKRERMPSLVRKIRKSLPGR